MTSGCPLHALVIAAAAGWTSVACAGNEVARPHAAVVVGETSRSLCFGLVAERSHIPESLLRAIAKIESNYRPDAVHQDADGTHDVGVMQINSSHFPELESRYHITERILLERPCVNIAVGARILSGFLNQYGSTWRAIGSYGAGMASAKERARLQYANLVARALTQGWHANQVATAVVAARRMVVIE